MYVNVHPIKNRKNAKRMGDGLPEEEENKNK